jgi:hypothetical protein
VQCALFAGAGVVVALVSHSRGFGYGYEAVRIKITLLHLLFLNNQNIKTIHKILQFVQSLFST